jgi:hypothetical protein
MANSALGSAAARVALAAWDEIIEKQADESVTSSTALQDDNELKFDVVTDGVYEFKVVLAYVEPAGSGTPDLDVAFGVSAGAVAGGNSGSHVVGTTGGAAVHTVNNTVATEATLGTAGGSRVVVIEGWVRATADAVFSLQWAQNVSSGNTVTVQAGSVLMYRRIR